MKYILILIILITHVLGNEQSRPVERIIEHYDYNVTTQANDIAIIKVATPFHKDGLTVLPVCVPPFNYPFAGILHI